MPIGEYYTASAYSANDYLYAPLGTGVYFAGSTDVIVGDGIVYLQSVYASGDNEPTIFASVVYGVDPILV